MFRIVLILMLDQDIDNIIQKEWFYHLHQLYDNFISMIFEFKLVNQMLTKIIH
jgi:hypothetical protein